MVRLLTRFWLLLLPVVVVVLPPLQAPRSVQESCGCIIGVDYPRPIVDHAIVSKVPAYLPAYQQHLLTSTITNTTAAAAAAARRAPST